MREYNAESPKQGRKRFNSIVKTMCFSYLPVIYLWYLLSNQTLIAKENVDLQFFSETPGFWVNFKSSEGLRTQIP